VKYIWFIRGSFNQGGTGDELGQKGKTGIHLARRIGEALKHAYQGDLDFTYGDGEKGIRMTGSGNKGILGTHPDECQGRRSVNVLS
jgi:hypothetical protein